MLFFQGRRNGLRHVFRPGDFARIGIRADYGKDDTVYLSRNGKRLGRITRSVGKFVWHAPDTGQPQFSAFTPDAMLSGLASRT
jgi:hypothetical protein